MKRISPGYYVEECKIKGYTVEIQIVQLEDKTAWYWDYSIPSLHKYNAGGSDYFSTKRDAVFALKCAIADGLLI